MKQKIIITLSVVLLAFVGLAGFIAINPYWGTDELSRMSIDTNRVLARYERSGNPTEARKFVADNLYSDALTSQMMLDLGQWSVSHKPKFIRLIQGISGKDLDVFLVLFPGAIAQGGGDTDFKKAFAGSNNRIIKRLLDYM